MLPFDYQITRSRRKTLAIYVRHNQVEVRAPQHTFNRTIESFVKQKASWILNQLEQQAHKVAEQYQLKNNSPLPYLGSERLLQIQQLEKGRSHIQLNEQHWLIKSKHTAPDSLHRLFHRWLKQQAHDYMVPRAQALAHQLGLTDKLGEIKFRNTKSKWGHCKADGTLQFNQLIMLAPPAVIDYLIAQEGCHLRHHNHSATYWRLVASVCPEMPSHKAWLRKNSHKFIHL